MAVFDFGALPASQLLVKVAISSVSEENALLNLNQEAPQWDFDAKRSAAATAWRNALAALDIEAAEPMRRSLYTALYHSLMAPSVFMDVDGSYRGADHEVHHADGFVFRSTFSLWDTYRALHPLLILLRPESDNTDFIRSLLASWRWSPDGVLPVWQFAGQETWTMIGYHAVPVIADAYLKGIPWVFRGRGARCHGRQRHERPLRGTRPVHEVGLGAGGQGQGRCFQDPRVRVRRLDDRPCGKSDGA